MRVSLPDHHHQSAGGPERPSDVRERGNGIMEEHRPEPTDDDIEGVRRKWMVLRLGVLEGHVGDPFRPSQFASAGDRFRGAVDPHSFAFGGQPCHLTGRLSYSASDIEDVVVALDAVGAAQHLV